jgi:hypothetical protein
LTLTFESDRLNVEGRYPTRFEVSLNSIVHHRCEFDAVKKLFSFTTFRETARENRHSPRSSRFSEYTLKPSVRKPSVNSDTNDSLDVCQSRLFANDFETFR